MYNQENYLEENTMGFPMSMDEVETENMDEVETENMDEVETEREENVSSGIVSEQEFLGRIKNTKKENPAKFANLTSYSTMLSLFHPNYTVSKDFTNKLIQDIQNYSFTSVELRNLISFGCKGVCRMPLEQLMAIYIKMYGHTQLSELLYEYFLE